MSYSITKTYGHNAGLSACFRQHAATTTHCQYLHGYALKVEITLECIDLDHRNWVFSFGGMKPMKKWLEEMFDHKTLVAQDDPELQMFQHLDNLGIIQLNVVERVGCEAFAKMIFDKMNSILVELGKQSEPDAQFEYNPLVWASKVSVSEHEGNTATFTEDGL